MLAEDTAYQKGRVFRVSIGEVMPPPPDAPNTAESKREREHEKGESTKAYVFVRTQRVVRVVEVACDDRCVELKQKLESSPDIEIRFDGRKASLRCNGETIQGRRYSGR